MSKTIIGIVFLLNGAMIVNAQTAKPGQMENGKKVYTKNCLACHMADGNGVPGLNPPLGKTDWVTGDKKRLINIILKGLNDPIVVNGDEYANPMPPQDFLSDQEIADVLTYIRASFGNKASAVSPADVKHLRPKK
ncbi:MAG TPA: cytochrome c [Phnomibacter sp.]|nr:cytochrome c [Phnomibacter sp.]